MEQNAGILTPNYLKEYTNYTSAIAIQTDLDNYAKIKLPKSLGIRRTVWNDQQGEDSQSGVQTGTFHVC